MPELIYTLDEVAIANENNTLFILFPEIYEYIDMDITIPHLFALNTPNLHVLEEFIEGNKSIQDFFAFMEQKLPQIALKKVITGIGGLLEAPYTGCVVIDIVPDTEEPNYRKILAHYENEDGKPKNPEKARLFFIDAESGRKMIEMKKIFYEEEEKAIIAKL